MGDGLIEAVIQQVGSGHGAAQPGPLPIRACHSVQVIQCRSQRAHPGIEALAEQVRDRGHARCQRGCRAHITGIGGQLTGGPVRLRRGCVVVGGGGFVTQGGEQCGPVQRRMPGGQVACRPAVQFQRLAVSRHRSGLARGSDRMLIGEPGTPCLLEVRRDERTAVATLGRSQCHPFVQAAAHGQVGVRVEGITDQCVPEVETDRVTAGEDEICALQLAQCGGHLVRAGVSDRGQQVETERTPDDSRCRRDLAGTRGQPPCAAQHGVTQRVRHRGGLDRRAGVRRQGVLVDGGEEFLDMQRDPVAALVDRLLPSGPALAGRVPR